MLPAVLVALLLCDGFVPCVVWPFALSVLFSHHTIFLESSVVTSRLPLAVAVAVVVVFLVAPVASCGGGNFC